MAQRIYWEPPSELTPTQYAVSVVGLTSETPLATLPNQIPGPYWQGIERRYTFEDPSGTDTTVYRVRAYGPAGELYADSGPFQPSAAIAAGLVSRRHVNHDFGAVNALQYVAPSGPGIPDAIIRVFRATEWDAGRRDAAEYVVSTITDGKWKNSVWLPPGLAWVLVFEKPGSYGPDSVRIST